MDHQAPILSILFILSKARTPILFPAGIFAARNAFSLLWPSS